ncbi:replication-associated recombination protein A [Sulfurospirillum arcachonense]|uniref:replication-associated recombination protein A n=1 Tax=Sulfurospirillum arcachonense TaxID=57666 RepID=UPI00046A7081|nr:replication-associated recombination protein A [Sulfurospirillum arcachonense]
MDNLALKLRPTCLEELSGQKHLSSENSPFFKLLKSGTIPHCIFFGPAGVGKTTLARIVSKELELPFYELDATSVKVDAFRTIFANHKHSLAKPLIFIDEVHRLSKTQQEVLLLPMENKEAIIIGASTENPYFTLSSGIRSRSMLFEFFSLHVNDLEEVIERAKAIVEFSIDTDAKRYLLDSSAGDSRSLLNLLEFAIKVDTHVTLEILKSLRPNALKDGVSSDDTHYNLISAMIKSVRGSDVDAALYYLARLIDGGESADFIARRLVILASEDVGNANPNALNLASSCLNAVSKIGFPESRIILAQTLVYLTCCPKSNSCYKGINEALAYVKNEKALQIPSHLKSPSPKGYKYPHDFGGWVEQNYLEKNLHFYENSTMGFEKTLEEWLKKIKS